jgi:DNA-binding NarL/FixJ family response regulator
MKKARFVIAIDSYIVRKGVSSIIKTIPGIDLVSETDNVDTIRNIVKEGGVDFLVVSTGLLTRLPEEIAEHLSLNGMLILIRPDEEKESPVSLRLSISVKSPKEEIISKLESVAQSYTENREEEVETYLSEREKTILKHVAMGMTNREIAEKLFLSLHTVTTHRKNIGNKLGIKSVSGLTVYAIVNNIISIEDIQK